MALSDCEKCWDTPCTCGWQYKHWSKERIIEFINGVLKYRDDKEEIVNKLKSENK